MVGFNPIFYAGRPKLSQVTIDSDLDMGGRNILRARIGSPYTPDTWETVPIDWGDVPAETVVPPTVKVWTVSVPSVDIYTAAISGYYTLTIERKSGTYHLTRSELRVNGDTVVTLDEVPWSYTLMLNAGDVLSVHAVNYSGPTGAQGTCSVVFTGEVGGAKTLDLTGKWLALGIDMQGLAATVKIQGVETPYSDYAKYFPLAPSELKTPGNWDATQIRPDVEVYK